VAPQVWGDLRVLVEEGLIYEITTKYHASVHDYIVIFSLKSPVCQHKGKHCNFIFPQEAHEAA